MASDRPLSEERSLQCKKDDMRVPPAISALSVTGSLNLPFWSRHANELSLKQITMLMRITRADLAIRRHQAVITLSNHLFLFGRYSMTASGAGSCYLRLISTNFPCITTLGELI